MTATLAAMLVDQHKLKWETTVGEIFPEWHDMNPEWRAVTLEQLLTHRAGAPHDAPPDLWAQAWKKIGLPKQQRLAFVHGLVTRAPEAPPGTKFIYSNQGYSIAGAMIERVTGLAWETLMREMLFEPLAIQSAGFGAPGTPGKTDEPWGHVFENGKLKPIPPGPDADNPAAIGPGGIVHLSISDFARYAQWHARGVFNGRRLLSDASFSKIHTSAAGGDYAMGWGVYQRDWSGGVTFTHNGSNTMWFAVMWVSPAKDAAFVAATNVAGDEAEKACDEAVFALIQRVLLHQ
jgi:CubicO group peptidase (beta-lactamase class C family)